MWISYRVAQFVPKTEGNYCTFLRESIFPSIKILSKTYSYSIYSMYHDLKERYQLSSQTYYRAECYSIFSHGGLKLDAFGFYCQHTSKKSQIKCIHICAQASNKVSHSYVTKALDKNLLQLILTTGKTWMPQFESPARTSTPPPPPPTHTHKTKNKNKKKKKNRSGFCSKFVVTFQLCFGSTTYQPSMWWVCAYTPHVHSDDPSYDDKTDAQKLTDPSGK